MGKGGWERGITGNREEIFSLFFQFSLSTI